MMFTRFKINYFLILICFFLCQDLANAAVQPPQITPEQFTQTEFKLIVFLGRPGAGKGTLAQHLISRGYKHISVGDLLREELRQNSALGLKYRKYIETGHSLLPPNVVESIIFKKIVSSIHSQDKLVLDGFPRTISQAQALETLLKKNQVDHAVRYIYIKTSEKNAKARVLGRQVCTNCHAVYHIKFCPPVSSGICNHCKNKLIQRSSDNERDILKRMDVYNTSVHGVIQYYKKSRNLLEINGNKTIAHCINSLDRRV